MTVQAGLCRTCSKTQMVGFVMQWLISNFIKEDFLCILHNYTKYTLITHRQLKRLRPPLWNHYKAVMCKNLSRNNFPGINPKHGKLFQDRYTCCHIDFICSACSQSHWLSLADQVKYVALFYVIDRYQQLFDQEDNSFFSERLYNTVCIHRVIQVGLICVLDPVRYCKNSFSFYVLITFSRS